MSLDRIGAMAVKEFRQVFRDPRMARVIFVAPVLQLLVFGYAVSTDIEQAPAFLVDHDRSVASRELADVFAATGYFRIADRSDRPSDLVRALETGEAVLGLVIPAGFGADLGSARPARVQVLVDGTNSNTASVTRSYAERILADFARRKVPAFPPPVELRDRPWFNPNLESRIYNVPAVVGALIMLICLLLTSLAIVREREIGTLEQLKVSPLTAGELIAGKTIPFALIGLLDLTIVIGVALAWFEVPFRGSVPLLLLASVLYILSALGVGLLISTISSTQQEAFMASFLVFMPAILLSGFMFPVTSMPASFQVLTLANPVRHYMEIVRAVFLKGAGLEALSRQFAALALIGAGLLGFAAARFRRSARSA